MKALLRNGLGLALALVAWRGLAEEVQWRAAGTKTPAGNTAPAVPALGRPIPLDNPGPPPDPVTAASFRPAASVVRAKVDQGPLPLGPALPQEGIPKPLPPGKETLPIMPRPIVNGTTVNSLAPAPVIGSCGDYCPCDGGYCGCGWGNCNNWWGGNCRPRPRLWLSAEFLAWETSDQNTPALASTGVLPGGQILFDGSNQINDLRHGGRFTLGIGLPCFCNTTLETTFLFLGGRPETYTASSAEYPTLVRPINIGNAGAAVRVNSLAVDYDTSLWGIEANFRHNLYNGCRWHWDGFWGFRHLQLDDRMAITDIGQQGATVRDSFQTFNQFSGAQIGFSHERRVFRHFFLSGQYKLAAGVNHQTINIDGQTTVGGVTTPTGLLAQTSNIGHNTNDSFSVLGEIGIKLGYNLTCNCRIWVGYDFLLMTNAMRAGEQIDKDFTLGNPRPLVPYRVQDFWAQGFNFGLECRF